MRTKTAITHAELDQLRSRFEHYGELQAEVKDCVLAVSKLVGCTADDAVDLLNRWESAEDILGENGLMIAPDSKPSLRVVDYEEETYFPRTIGSVEIVLAGCAIACFIAVIAGAGVAWDWVFGGEW